jgi:exopolyphosphatase/guanosine-5'-triphosphate,3'-diphosphate pyrophosphatase
MKSNERTKPRAVKRIAGIDIGATSARMKIVELGARGGLKTLDHLVHPIALGMDTFRLGFVAPATIRALGMVLRNFKKNLKECDVAECRTVGTSAIREASNRDVVVDRLRHLSGLTLDLLDPEEETRLTYQALRSFLEANGLTRLRRVLALELGGGSTELMLLRNGNIIACGSRRLGVARLLYSGTEGAGDSRVLMHSLIQTTVGSVRDLIGAEPVEACVVINSLLAGVFSRLRSGETRRTADGLSVGPRIIALAAREAAALTVAETARRFSLNAAEAELALPALSALKAFVDLTKAPRVFLPDADFLSALIADMHREARGETPRAAFHAQTVSCVGGVAEKYALNRPHAERVRRLALTLFDALAGYLDLSAHDRVILEVAALLHDIGRFISDRDHHKHGMYIINWTDLVGLKERDRNLAALTVRYHRKARPNVGHAEYAGLRMEERMVVSKLAALLRIADALDRSHAGGVDILRVKIGEMSVELTARAEHDLSAEEAALRSKANLFEDLTGLKVSLRRVWS